MDKNYIITKIYGVYEGEFNNGFISHKNIGRHCDCLVFFTEGEIEYIFDTYTLNTGKDGLLYLAEGSKYSIIIKKPCKYIYVDFKIENEYNSNKSCIFKNISPSLKSEFIKIFYTWNKKNLWYIPNSFSTLYNIFTEIIKSENKSYAKQNKLFSKITSYILENYTSSTLNINDIANYAGISQVHLRRIFKSAANTTPIKYVNFLKLEKAKNMLINSNYNINEIASSVGFDDAYYFSRIFKKEFGISPSEYKKNHSFLLY